MRTPSFLYFDMGNVLLTFSHHRGAEQMARVTGIPVETVERIVYGSNGNNGLHWNFERGDFPPAEFYRRFYDLARCDAPPGGNESLAEACNDIFELNEPMLPVIAALRSAGRRIGVLSNTSCEHWDYVNRKFAPIMGLFPLAALSCNLERMKPDPAIYAKAAELCETPPGEIFFTDDRPENVAAARDAGWDAVVFHDAQRLRSDLLQRGIAEVG